MNATKNKTNIDELIQISNRLKEIEEETLTAVKLQTEAYNLKEKLNDNDTYHQNNLFVKCYDIAFKDDDVNAVHKLSQKDDSFFKNMTNNQINIENRKINAKYSDSEELDVETLSGDENKEEVSSMKRCLVIPDTNANVVKSRSRNSSSKSSSRSTSNSTVRSTLNLDVSHFRRLSYSSVSSAASSTLEQKNQDILIKNKIHKNRETSNGLFLSKHRGKSGFKRYQRAKTNNNNHPLQINADNRNINSKQGTASILINGKRYYRKLNAK